MVARILCAFVAALCVLNVAGDVAEVEWSIGKAIEGVRQTIQGGQANAGEKEGCFICEFVVRRIVALIGPPRVTLTLDDWDIALQTACGTLPAMAFQAVSMCLRLLILFQLKCPSTTALTTP